MRWRERLASPLGLLVAMPLLLLLTAGSVLLVNDGMVRRSAREQADLVFAAASARAGQRAREVFSHAGPVLDGLRGWTAGLGDVVASANAMRALIAGRPGLVRAYVAWPDGRLVGIERSDDGWDLLEMEPADDGSRISRRPLGRDGGLARPDIGSAAGFDVRERPWWRAAAGARVRTWSEPYLLRGAAQPGISCCEAQRGPDGRVAAVMAVDFELSAIGAALSMGTAGRGAHILFDADRTLISVPESWATGLPPDRLPRAADLHRAEAAGLFASLTALPEPGSELHAELTADGVAYGAVIQAVPVDGGPVWYLAQIIPYDLLSGSVDAARRSSLVIGIPAALLGAGLSLWYANLFRRSRREADQMRQRAQAAEAELRHIGAYRLVRKLGEGGMGEVWLGMHRMLARPAAIKRITAARLTGGDEDLASEARARFVTEARITASLRSRNTIELFDYGSTPEGGFYYVMEMLDGMDLSALVEKHGPLPAGRAIAILIQTCNSLAEAHDRGLVHRDIKPENIYICRRADEVDVVKVLDFGIVAVQSRELSAKVSKAGFVVGTPATMSPEQARGEQLDGRSDIYALGCVAYWLLTGSTVFPEQEQLAQILAHLNEAPEPPSMRAGRVLPDGLDQLVLSCLSKSREMRPADARNLAASLRGIAIPPDEAWNDAQAAAWWTAHVPPAPSGVLDQDPMRSASFTSPSGQVDG